MFQRIHLLDLQSKNLTKISDNPGKLGNFAFSPDGSKIVYNAAGELKDHAVSQVYVMDINGENYVFAVVEVVNGSEELDGTRKRYFLSVPASCRSAIEAVAWTYGMTVKQYRQLKVRT